MTAGFRNAIRLLALAWLLATVTIGLQNWIGDRTIYAAELESRRAAIHFGILENEAPGGGRWGAFGGLSIQKRVGVVYLAETLRRASGLAIGKVYKLLDTIFLFASLLALFFFLRRWASDIYALIGVLYFASVLPYTYLFQLFHPWDRVQLLIWIGLLLLVIHRRVGWLMLMLPLSIVVKFDTVLLPALYLLMHCSMSHVRRVLLETAAMFLAAGGTYLLLGQAFPSPMDVEVFTSSNSMRILEHNLESMQQLNLRYPPLLVHLLPLVLALVSLRSKGREVTSLVLFAMFLSSIYIMFSVYEEVRAHMIVLVLTLPAALLTTQRLLGNEGAGRSCQSVV